MRIVFQYGSNCDKERLNSPTRLGDAAVSKGAAQTVEDFEIAFDVWSQRNKCAAADLVSRGQRKAWGVLYEVPDDRIDGKHLHGLRTLADIEGPRYEKQRIEVTIGDQVKSAVTFLVKEKGRVTNLATSAEYVCHIIKGLRDVEVPDEYVQHVIEIAIANVKSASESAAAQKPAIQKLRST